MKRFFADGSYLTFEIEQRNIEVNLHQSIPSGPPVVDGQVRNELGTQKIDRLPKEQSEDAYQDEPGEDMSFC